MANDFVGDVVLGIKSWPLLGMDYWVGLFPKDTSVGTVWFSARVEPRDWCAPLIGGEPIKHQGLIVYWRKPVCEEYQRVADEWRRGR